MIHIYIVCPWLNLYFCCHNKSHIGWLMMNLHVHVIIKNVKIRTHIVILYQVDTATFLSLRCSVYDSRGWLCLHTTSYFPLFHHFSLCCIQSLLCWIWTCSYLQHVPWLMELPSVEYICVSIPWLLFVT